MQIYNIVEDGVKVFFRANLPHFYGDLKSLSRVTPAQMRAKAQTTIRLRLVISIVETPYFSLVKRQDLTLSP